MKEMRAGSARRPRRALKAMGMVVGLICVAAATAAMAKRSKH
jgi:hypothetical protein